MPDGSTGRPRALPCLAMVSPRDARTDARKRGRARAASPKERRRGYGPRVRSHRRAPTAQELGLEAGGSYRERKTRTSRLHCPHGPRTVLGRGGQARLAAGQSSRNRETPAIPPLEPAPPIEESDRGKAGPGHLGRVSARGRDKSVARLPCRTELLAGLLTSPMLLPNRILPPAARAGRRPVFEISIRLVPQAMPPFT